MNSTIKSFVIGLAVVLVGGFVVYQFVIPNTPAGEATTNPQVAGTSRGVPSANAAPDFTLKNLDGGTTTLSDYRGQKPVILDFFATWCPNCQRAMPQLSGWYDKYKDQVEVIGINLRENSSTVQRFIASKRISYPITLDTGRVASQYGIRYTNTHVLIDKNGSIVQTIPGDLRESHVLSLIQ